LSKLTQLTVPHTPTPPPVHRAIGGHCGPALLAACLPRGSRAAAAAPGHAQPPPVRRGGVRGYVCMLAFVCVRPALPWCKVCGRCSSGSRQLPHCDKDWGLSNTCHNKVAASSCRCTQPRPTPTRLLWWGQQVCVCVFIPAGACGSTCFPPSLGARLVAGAAVAGSTYLIFSGSWAELFALADLSWAAAKNEAAVL